MKNRPLNQALTRDRLRSQRWRRSSPYVTEEAKQPDGGFLASPLTIILKRKPIVSSTLTGGNNSIGLRAPRHAVPLAICNASGLPLTATSANKHGGPDPDNIGHALNQLKEGIDLFLDGGNVTVGVGSTVINLTDKYPTIVRNGPVKKDDIEAVIGHVATIE